MDKERFRIHFITWLIFSMCVTYIVASVFRRLGLDEFCLPFGVLNGLVGTTLMLHFDRIKR